MNADGFSDIEEAADWHRARLALANGWRLLDIYKTKRSVPYSQQEFEEHAVYILGLPERGELETEDSAELRKQTASSAITEMQRALAAHEQALTADEAEQHRHSIAAKEAIGRAIGWLEELR